MVDFHMQLTEDVYLVFASVVLLFLPSCFHHSVRSPYPESRDTRNIAYGVGVRHPGSQRTVTHGVRQARRSTTTYEG